MCTHMYVERSQSDRCMLKIYIYTCSPCQSLAAYGNSQISPVCTKKHVTWNECLRAEISNAYFVNALLSSKKKKEKKIWNKDDCLHSKTKSEHMKGSKEYLFNTVQVYCQVSVQLHEECFVVPSTQTWHDTAQHARFQGMPLCQVTEQHLTVTWWKMKSLYI